MPTYARRAGIVAALVSSAALIAPAFAGALPTGSLGSDESAPGFTCDATSTETSTNGWGIPFDDEKDQTASYSAENVLDEDGSRRWRQGSPISAERNVSGSIRVYDAAGDWLGTGDATPDGSGWRPRKVVAVEQGSAA